MNFSPSACTSAPLCTTTERLEFGLPRADVERALGKGLVPEEVGLIEAVGEGGDGVDEVGSDVDNGVVGVADVDVADDTTGENKVEYLAADNVDEALTGLVGVVFSPSLVVLVLASPPKKSIRFSSWANSGVA